MTTPQDCVDLMVARFNQFRHFHSCNANLPTPKRPEFFLEVSSTPEVYSPAPPWYGYEGDETAYCYKQNDEAWSSSNTGKPGATPPVPPESNSGNYSQTWDPVSGDIEASGSVYDPVDGNVNKTDDTKSGDTRNWHQYWDGEKDDEVNYADHERDWTLSERCMPSELLASAEAACTSDLFSAFDFAYRYPEVYLRYVDPTIADEDSASGMTTQGASNSVGYISKARIRFGIRGTTAAAAATVTFKVNCYEMSDYSVIDSLKSVLSDVPLNAHETEPDTYVTNAIVLPMPTKSWGGTNDEYSGNPYTGIGYWWIETLSGVVPKQVWQ